MTQCSCIPGLIILNAWYGKFVTDNSRKHERARVIDVTVPLQCLVKDSKLILTEASKVKHFVICLRELEYSVFRIAINSQKGFSSLVFRFPVA